MNKKDKKMDKDKWKTVGIEERWLVELRKEAEREQRSVQALLGLILKARYEPK